MKKAERTTRRRHPFAGWSVLRHCTRTGLLRSTALQAVALAGIVASPMASRPVFAQLSPTAAPTGGQVVAGQAAINQTTAQTTIDQASQRAAINWQTYDVGSAHTVQYNQPNSSALTLNRVVGGNPSEIAGHIQANGTVVIVNQAGMVFDRGAQVNVGGLVASTAGISNQNFMAGKMVFDQAGNPGAKIENRGTMTIADHGLASLVAPQVANSGVIRARMGKVILGGAEAYSLDLYGDGMLGINVTKQVTTAPDGTKALVTNDGVVSAAGGTVVLTANAVDGVVQTLVNAGGKISANTVGTHTGSVVVAGVGGDVLVTGTLAAAGRRAGTTGGTVAVNTTGTVTLASTAKINASGKAGGGVIAVGTTVERAKGGPSVASAQTANSVVVAQGATVAADATGKGKGGTVTLLSSNVTRMNGLIAAKGGPSGGDGGFVEVSGTHLGINTGSIDVSSLLGQAGTILFDPATLAVVSAAGGLDGGFAGTGTVATGDGAASDTISSAALNAFAGNVTLQATVTLDVQSSFTIGSGSLTMQAGVGMQVENGVTVSASGDILAMTTAAGVGIGIGGLLTSTGGSVTLKTPAGSGIALANFGTVSAPTAGKSIVLQSDTINFNSGKISAPSGTVEIAPVTAGYTISLGSANSAGTLGLSGTLGGISAAMLRLGQAAGSTTAGAIAFDTSVDLTGIATTLDVHATGGISRTADTNVLTVGTLTGGAGGDLNLAGGNSDGNAIGTVGSFSVGAGNSFSLLTTGGVTFAGTVDAGTAFYVGNIGSGDVKISGSVGATNNAQIYGVGGGTINVSGSLISPSITLGQSGAVAITGNGVVGKAGGTLDVSASNGFSEATTGTILASTLQFAPALYGLGNVSLLGTGNAITTLGSLTSTGDIAIVSSSALTIGNTLQATGSIFVQDSNAGGVTIGATGSVLAGSGKLASFLTDAFGNSGTVIAGTVEIAPNTNASTLKLGTGGGVTSVGGINATTVRLGAVTQPGSASPGITAGSIAIASDFGTSTVGLDLQTTGTISQTGGSLTASTLTGTAAAVALTTVTNKIGTLGAFGAANSFILADAQNLLVAGTVGVTSGPLQLEVLGGNTLTMGAGGSLAVASGQTLSVISDAVSFSAGHLGASGAVVELMPATSGGTIDFAGTGSETLALTQANLSVISADTLRLGKATFNGTTNTNAGQIIFDSNVDLTGIASTLDLHTTGSVTAANNSVLTVGTLTGSIVGSMDLAFNGGTDTVGVIGNLDVNAAAGSLAMNFANSPTIAGTLSSHDMTLHGNADFTITGSVNAPGSFFLFTSNTLTTSGTITSGYIVLQGNSGIAITGGEISNPTGLVRLNSTTIEDASAKITAGTIDTTGGSNNFSLIGTANAIDSIDTLFSSGNLTLVDSSALTVTNGVSAAGSVLLQVTNAGGLTNNGTIQAGGAGQTLGLLTDKITNTGTFINTGGTIELAPNTVGTIVNIGTGTGGLQLTQALLSKMSAGTLRFGGVTSNGTLVQTAGSIAILGSVNLSGISSAVDLQSTGGVTAGSSDALDSIGTLTGKTGALSLVGFSTGLTAIGDYTVTGGGDFKVQVIGSPGVTGTLAANNVSVQTVGASTVSVSGTVAAAGTTSINSGAITIASGGAVQGTSITLNGATGVAINGTGVVGKSGQTTLLDLDTTIGDVTEAAAATINAGTLTSATNLGGNLILAGTKNAIGTISNVTPTGGTLQVVNSSSLALAGAINLGSSGKLDVGLSSGALTQGASGTIITKTFTSSSSIAGGVNLAGTANQIGTISGLNTSGTLAVVNGQGLTLAGLVNAGTAGTADFSATAGLTQAANATLIADVLTSGSGISGGATLAGTANAIGTISGLSASVGLTVVDTKDLTLAGKVSGNNAVDITTSGSLIQGAGGTLIAGTLSSTGGIGGTVNLAGTANQIGTISGLTASGGSLAVVNSQSLGLEGLVSASPTGTVDITTSAGGVRQGTSGTLVTGTLTSTGDIAGGVLLTGTANSIGTIAALTAGGTLAVVDSNALVLAGKVSAGSTGTVDITTTSGGLTQGASGTLIAGTLTSQGSIAGAVTLAGTANQIGTISFLTAVNALTVVNSQAMALANVVSVGTAGVVDITLSSGALTQAIGGALTAGTLTSTGNIAGGVTLAGAGNQIATLSNLTTTGTLAITDGQALTLAGLVNAGTAGVISLSSGSGGVTQGSNSTLIADTLTSSILVGNMTLAGTANSIGTIANINASGGTLVVVDNNSLALAGSVNASSLVDITVNSGSLVQGSSGMLTTQTLTSTGGIASGVTLAGTANNIGTISGLTTSGTLKVVDSILTLAGLVNVGTAGVADFSTTAGGISQAAGATLIAGTLTSSGTLSGISNLGGTANAIGTISNLISANGLTIVDNQDLSLAGIVSVGTNGFFDITTRSGGKLTQGAGGTIVAGRLTSAGGIAGAVSLLGTANAISFLVGMTAGGTLAVVNSSSLGLNSVVSAGSTGVVDITTLSGDLNQLGGTIVAGTLTSTGGIAGNASLIASNQIGTLSGVTVSGGTLTLNNAGSLALAGLVSTGTAGTTTIGINSGGLSQGASGTLVTGTLTSAAGINGPISLKGTANQIGTLGNLNGPSLIAVVDNQSLVLGGFISATGSGTVDVTLLNGGTLSETAGASLTAATLTSSGGIAGGVDLTAGTNNVGTIAGLTTAGTLAVKASTLTLAGLVSVGTAGVADFTLPGGGLTQAASGTLIAGTLTSSGNIAGAIALAGTANSIGTLSGISSVGAGSIAVTDSTDLTLAGVVSATTVGTIDLTTVGTASVTQGAGGTVIAGTLTSSGGIAKNMVLSGTANQIGTIAGVTAGGTLGVVDSTALVETGTIAAPTILLSGTGLTLNGFVNAGTVLALGATTTGVTQGVAGTIAAGTLSSIGTITGGISLNSGNTIGTLANFAFAGPFALKDSGTLSIGSSVQAGAGDTINLGAQAVTIGSGGLLSVGTVTIATTNGGVGEAVDGTIVTNSISITTTGSGDVRLLNPNNQIKASTGIQVANGNLVFIDDPTLTLTGTYSAANQLFEVTLAGDSIALGSGGTPAVLVSTLPTGGRISLVADVISEDPASSITATKGTVEIAPFTNTVTQHLAGSTQLAVDSTLLGEINTGVGGSLVIGAYTGVDSNTTISAAGISLDGNTTLTGKADTLVLATLGSVTQGAGTLSVATLTGTAGAGGTGAVALNQTGNNIGTLAAFAVTGGGFSLADTGNTGIFTVAGPVTATTGTIALSNANTGTIAVTGSVGGGATLITLAAGSGGITESGSGVLDATTAGTVDLSATGGGVTQLANAGTIIAGTLTSSNTVTGTVSLFSSTNTIGTLATFPVATGNFALKDTVGLTATGSLGAGSVTLNAASLTLAANDIINAPTGTLDITTTAGGVSQPATGTINAGTLLSSGGITGGSVSLAGTDNAIGTLTHVLVATGGDFSLRNRDANKLTVGGSIAADAVSADNVTITAGTLDANYVITATKGTVGLTATTGALTQSGTVNAVTGATLTGQTNLDNKLGGTIAVSNGPVSLIATTGTLGQAGSVSATTGGTLTAATSLSNSGSVVITGGPAVLQATTNDLSQTGYVQGSSISETAGGSLSHTGTSKATVTSASLVAQGGTLNQTGTVLAVTSGSLSAKTDLANSGTVAISAGGVTLVANTGTLNQSGSVSATTDGTITAATTLFNSGSVTITGGPAVLQAITNDVSQSGLVQGASLSETAGGSLYNFGTSQATLTTATLVAQGGQLSNLGTVLAVTGAGLTAKTDLNTAGTSVVNVTNGPASLVAQTGTITDRGNLTGTSVSETAATSLFHYGTANATTTTATLVAQGGQLSNLGTVLAVTGAGLTAQTDLANATTGVVTVSNGPVSLIAQTGSITQQGTVNATSGGTLTAQTDLNNTGSVIISAGTATLTATTGTLFQNGLVRGTAVIETAAQALSHGGTTDATVTNATLVAQGSTLSQLGTVTAVTAADLTAKTDLTNNGLVSVTGNTGTIGLIAQTGSLIQFGTVQTTGTAGAVSETAATNLSHGGLTSAGSGGATLVATTGTLFSSGTITAANGNIGLTAGQTVSQTAGTIQTTGTAATQISLVAHGTTTGTGIFQNPGAVIQTLATNVASTITIGADNLVSLSGLTQAGSTATNQGTVTITAGGTQFLSGGTVGPGIALFQDGTVIGGSTVNETATIADIRANGTTTAGAGGVTITANDGSINQLAGTIQDVNTGAIVLQAKANADNATSGTVATDGATTLIQAVDGTISVTADKSILQDGGTIQTTGTGGTLISLSAIGNDITQLAGAVIRTVNTTVASTITIGAPNLVSLNGLVQAGDTGTGNGSVLVTAGGASLTSGGTVVPGSALLQTGTVIGGNLVNETATQGDIAFSGVNTGGVGGVTMTASDGSIRQTGGTIQDATTGAVTLTAVGNANNLTSGTISQSGGLIQAANGTIGLTADRLISQTGGTIQTTGAGGTLIALRALGTTVGDGINQAAGAVIQTLDTTVATGITLSADNTLSVGGLIQAGSTVTNLGTVGLTAGAASLISGATVATGTVLTQTGTVIGGNSVREVAAHGDVAFSGTSTAGNGGVTVQVLDGSFYQTGGTVQGVNSGTVDIRATLAGGFTHAGTGQPGTLALSGGLIQTENGTIALVGGGLFGGAITDQGAIRQTGGTIQTTGNTTPTTITMVSNGTNVTSGITQSAGALIQTQGTTVDSAITLVSVTTIALNGTVQAGSTATNKGTVAILAHGSNLVSGGNILPGTALTQGGTVIGGNQVTGTATVGDIAFSGLSTAGSGGLTIVAADGSIIQSAGTMQALNTGTVSVTATANGNNATSGTITQVAGLISGGSDATVFADTTLSQLAGGTIAAGTGNVLVSTGTGALNQGGVISGGGNATVTGATSLTQAATGSIVAGGNASVAANSGTLSQGGSIGAGSNATITATADLTQTATGRISATSGSVTATATLGALSQAGSIGAGTDALLNSIGSTLSQAGAISAGRNTSLLAPGSVQQGGTITSGASVTAQSTTSTITQSGTANAGSAVSMLGETGATQSGTIAVTNGAATVQTTSGDVEQSGSIASIITRLKTSSGTVIISGTLSNLGHDSGLSPQYKLPNIGSFPDPNSNNTFGLVASGTSVLVTKDLVVSPSGSPDLVFQIANNGTLGFENLNAPNARLWLDLHQGLATGQIDVASLQVKYDQPGTSSRVNLVGVVNGKGSTAAAAGSFIQPLPKSNYLLNGCPIGSLNCIRISIVTVPVTNPLKDIDVGAPPPPTDVNIMLPDVGELDY